MRVVWNGGFELDWKIVSAIAWALWMTAGGWYKLSALEKAVLEHNAWASQKADSLTVANARLSSLEERIDPCCPLFHSQPRRHRSSRGGSQ